MVLDSAAWSPFSWPNMRPTVQHIAKAAGLSVASVSHILSNREPYVSQFRRSTIERVRRISEELGYRQHILAAGLRSLRSPVFALLIRAAPEPQASGHGWRWRAFESEFLYGVLEGAGRRGLYPLIGCQQGETAEGVVRRVSGLLDGGVFGGIVLRPRPALVGDVRERIERGQPLVIAFPQALEAFATNVVDVDNRRLGELAAELLAQEGRRRVVAVGESPGSRALQDRLRGFMHRARELGIDVHARQLRQDASGQECVRELMVLTQRAGANGLFGLTARAALVGLQACEGLGLALPEDASLVGCDMFPWQLPGHPQITSVGVCWAQAGQRCLQELVALRDGEMASFANVLLAPQVTPGDTTRRMALDETTADHPEVDAGS